MNQQIWKFSLQDKIEMPKGAEILTVQMQGGNPCMWALCNPELETVERNFIIIGTGQPFEPLGKVYIGTYQELEGMLIWHLFEVTETQNF